MNNRGQAMLESLLVGLIFMASLTFFLRFALRVQKDLLIDEYVEQTFICYLEQKQFCSEKLRQLLSEQNYTSISIVTQHTKETIRLQLKAVSIFDESIVKESEIFNDLTITY